MCVCVRMKIGAWFLRSGVWRFRGGDTVGYEGIYINDLLSVRAVSRVRWFDDVMPRLCSWAPDTALKVCLSVVTCSGY